MKLLTHAYLANIILDELERTGGLSLPDVKGNYSSGSLREPFPSAEGGALCFPLKEGTYAPPDTVKETILNNREYFRGGVIGGSFLPDIAFSMSVLRPTDSGIWLEYLSDRFKTLKKGTERDQVYAFLLGMTVNYTADMFLRSYVTECAGGVFDSYSKDMGKRHLLIDEYIERAISFKIPDDKLKISVPSKFLAVCFADGLAVENQIKKIKDEKRSKKVLSAYNGKPLTQLRSRSYRSSGVLDEKRRESSEVLVYPEDMKKKITETEQWVAA
ncbi:MAG: zinc dependent phospholipase C family protein, partial [Methanomassiliicoccaceae archaeon]|nr:zinc dependent phospholipase C family protein [Methanomassiliicoccaceae archaeon]